MRTHRIVVTPGEPAGIGPDLTIQLAQYNWPVEIVVCADASILQSRACLLNLPLKLLPYFAYKRPTAQRAGTLTLLPVSALSTVEPGKLNAKNSHYVINTLLRACDGCQSNEFDAIVTGPIHKGIINDVGIKFLGHTEFFKEYTQSKTVVMMLVTEVLRVALVTTHVPIKTVSTVITIELLCDVITVLYNNLRSKFGIHNPHILICGLNPHAGEGGYIGNEEVSVIIPAIKEMQARGVHLTGPLPADSIFQPKYLDNSDVILAMYHDQGLPVIKYQNFYQGVNVTLGLPFIRTSVNHGTALDLAGQGKADVNSFITAINIAIKMIIGTK